jgi:hypothetical protein
LSIAAEGGVKLTCGRRDVDPGSYLLLNARWATVHTCEQLIKTLLDRDIRTADAQIEACGLTATAHVDRYVIEDCEVFGRKRGDTVKCLQQGI